MSEWLPGQIQADDADAVVFDYVGFPAEMMREIADETGLPVFDLGHLALDALADILD